MPKTKLAKATYCLAGGSTLVGCFFATKSLLIGEKTSDLLKLNNRDKQLLSKTSSVDKWKKSWFKYRVANMNRDKDIWGISDWEKEDFISDNVLPPLSFIEACESNSNARVTSTKSALYQEIIKWCTGSSKIKDLIRDDWKRTLTDKKFDEEGWKTLFNSYATTHKNNTNNPIGMNFSIYSDSGENRELLEKFKEKCKALSDKEVSGTTDPIYEKVKNYCSANIKAEDVIRDSFPKRKLIDLNKLKNSGSDFKSSSAAQRIWDEYKRLSKNPWGISDLESTTPVNFWEKCEEKRKIEVKGSEDEPFKEVLSYCTLYEAEFDEKYAEDY